jgi:hypothetical protein
MAREIFMDTSGFCSLLVKRGDRHDVARKRVQQARRTRQRFVTTDYVLDETATLLKARGHSYLVPELFKAPVNSTACRIEWTDQERFQAALALFLRTLDPAWSFTDCVSFRVMNELQIVEALTKDTHFEQAGFVALLK